MTERPFHQRARQAQREGRRLVAPLMDFPGLSMTGGSVKLAQQNYGEHYKVVKLLTETFQPDLVFPLMDLSVEAGADTVSLDSPDAGVDLPVVAERLPQDVMVIGNINPTGVLLRGRPAEVEAEVTDLLRRMAPFPNLVLSTGCDLPQETPLENIHAFMRAGRRCRGQW